MPHAGLVKRCATLGVPKGQIGGNWFIDQCIRKTLMGRWGQVSIISHSLISNLIRAAIHNHFLKHFYWLLTNRNSNLLSVIEGLCKGVVYECCTSDVDQENAVSVSSSSWPVAYAKRHRNCPIGHAKNMLCLKQDVSGNLLSYSTPFTF